MLSVTLLPLAGGVTALLNSRANANDFVAVSANEQKSVIGLIGTGLAVPTFIGLYALLVVRRQLDWRNVRLVVLAVGLVAANGLVNNFIANPRFWFGTVAFSLLIAVWPLINRRRVRTCVLGVLAALVLVFPLADYYRYSGGQRAANPVGHGALLSADFDAYQQTLNGVSYVRAEGHKFGGQLASAALFWVPREVWPGKAPNTGDVIADHAGYDYTNLSSPIWLEAFVDFSWIGVFVLLGAFGWLSQRLDEAYRAGATFLAAFAPVFAVYQMFLLRGSLLPSIARIVVIFVLLLLCSRPVARLHSRTAPSG